MQCLVVNALVQVLDEDVAKAALPVAGVAMGPHDADGLAVQGRKVQGVKGSGSYRMSIGTVLLRTSIQEILYGPEVRSHRPEYPGSHCNSRRRIRASDVSQHRGRHE